MAARFAVAWAGISLLVLLVAVLPAGAAVNAASDFTLGGFVQSRLVFQKDADPASSFTDSRFYISGMATTGTDTKVGFLLTNFTKQCSDPAANVGGGVLMAYGQKTSGKDTYRMGIYSTPFGYEQPLSAASLVTLDRSVVTNTLVAPYVFENGFFWNRADKGKTIAIGVTNGKKMSSEGLPVNGDTNNGKNISARFGSVNGNQSCGVSAIYGRGGDTKVFGADFQSTGKNVTLLGELLWGEKCDTTSDGFYLTAACNKAGQQYHPYARLEWFDPDTDQSSNDFTGVTVGVSRQVNALTKESLEVSNGQQKTYIMPAQTSSSGGQTWKATYQWQAKF